MAVGFGRIDLHMHSTLSDGTDTPEELLKKVKAANIGLFSVTDHDSIKSGRMIREALCGKGPSFITGVEFSCKDESGECHILGYGFDPENAAILGAVDHSHGFRIKKINARLDFLKTTFGFSFSEDDIAHLFSLENPGKPHIGNMMVKYGYAKTKEDAIINYIDRIEFDTEYIGPKEAITSIIAGGGIPVLAHPFFGSGNDMIVGDMIENRIRKLMGYGLDGIEAYYSGFSEKLRFDALLLAEKFGLLITAGSDYHGANKPVKLGDTGLMADEEYPEGLRRFAEIIDSMKN